MLPQVLDLADHTVPNVFDFLYPYFQKDFIEQDAYIAKTIYVDPNGQGMRDGKEEVFWHITTRQLVKKIKQNKKIVTLKTRPFDIDRACRIEWIRPILLNHNHKAIKLFYRRETKGKKPIRLYFWAHEYDFVVIVQKLGKTTSYLVTSFYITEKYKRKSYQKWFDEYANREKPELNGCEWF